MVKRKRTLSVKENSEIVSHNSDADQLGDDAKRMKTVGSPVCPDDLAGSFEFISTQHSPTQHSALSCLTTAPSVEGSESSSLAVPSNTSHVVPDVPLSSTQDVPQARPMQQLRTSARVLNKQRREETKLDVLHPVGNALKKSESSVAGLDAEYPDEEDHLTGPSVIGKKRRRAWELWSLEDKNYFFESINECGKDFEAIQNYITNKLRKKGSPGYQIKNKDQVRHFYYRTWHKISKHLTFSEGVKKATQELYGLINYGELRKKVGGTLDERKGQKLQELIRKGSTSVRVKGKSVRVRTPICRALKKLNQIEEHRDQGEVRVPRTITVEVVPGSIHTWCYVQGMAHNPRVRVSSPLQRPLSHIISHLQEKWRSSDLKLRETLSTQATFPLDLDQMKEPVLRLFPPKGCSVKPISVQPDVVMKSSTVSLLSHEARLRRRGEKLGRNKKRKNENKLGKDGGGVYIGGDTEEVDGESIRCDIGGEDLEDLGEMSQEELKDNSDGEDGVLNSPDGDQDEGLPFSPGLHPTTASVSVPANIDDVGYDPKQRSTNSGGDGGSDSDHRHSSTQNALVNSELRDGVRSPKELQKTNTTLTDERRRKMSADSQIRCAAVGSRLYLGSNESELDETDITKNDEVQYVSNKSGTMHSNGSNGMLTVAIKEEPSDDSLQLPVYRIPADPYLRVKEEPETGDALRRLLALETVAGAGAVEDNADIVCIGESTRLTSHVMEQQKGPLSSNNQGLPCQQLSQEQLVSLSPEPKEDEDKDPDCEVDKAPEPNTDAWLQKIRCGWTINNVEGITVGELYLLFGHNNKLCLEYEFEDPEKVEKDQSPESVISAIEKGSNDTSVKAAPQVDSALPSAVGACKLLSADDKSTDVNNGSEKQYENVRTTDNKVESSNVRGGPCEVDKPLDLESVNDKRTAVENLSGMLTQLLSMAKVLLARSPSEASCPCGHVCGRSTGGFRSPASSRCQGMLGIGRSPGSTRSPRNRRVTSANVQSPGLQSPGPFQAGSGGQSPVSAKALKERSKPASAKRLIPDLPDQQPLVSQQVNANTSGSCDGIPNTSSVEAAYMTPNSTNGVKVVMGSDGDAGEFRVPIAPAPRQSHTQQANFNAQLNKLLPRYNNRRGRTVVRKSVVVQRQLTLLPKTIVQPPVLTMNVLPQSLQDQTMKLDKRSCVPITIASAPPTTVNSASSQKLVPSSSVLSSTGPVRNVALHTVQSSAPLSPQTDITPPLGTTPHAISVNISGQPLLTVAMPSSINAPIIMNNSSHNPVLSTTDLLRAPAAAKPNSPTVHSTVSNAQENKINNISENGLLQIIAPQTFTELPDLSSPLGIPLTVSTTKCSTSLAAACFSSDANVMTTPVCTSSSEPGILSSALFNSSLSLDTSIPNLSNRTMTNISVVSTMPSASLSASGSSQTSEVPYCPTSLSLSPIPTLLATTSTSHLELSPPPTQTNTIPSLLNTPVPHSSNSNPSCHNVSPTPPSLSSLLVPSPPDLGKTLSSLLTTAQQDNTSSISVPELHIPEGSVSLPLLDISLGGTATLTEQTPNSLINGCEETLGMELPVTSSSSATTSTPVKEITSTSSSVMNSALETSSDKLLDIALGISNSNSSFSSLLAAATQPRGLDSSMLGTPTMEGDGCGGEGISHPVSVNISDGIARVQMAGFPAVDSTPPSPPSSPSRLLQQSDNQWLNNEVNDFSLSSFLGHLESPIKGSSSHSSSQAASTSSLMPSLITVYNENSVDFTAKFAEMKAQASSTFKQ